MDVATQLHPQQGLWMATVSKRKLFKVPARKEETGLSDQGVSGGLHDQHAPATTFKDRSTSCSDSPMPPQYTEKKIQIIQHGPQNSSHLPPLLFPATHSCRSGLSVVPALCPACSLSRTWAAPGATPRHSQMNPSLTSLRSPFKMSPSERRLP